MRNNDRLSKSDAQSSLVGLPSTLRVLRRVGLFFSMVVPVPWCEGQAYLIMSLIRNPASTLSG